MEVSAPARDYLEVTQAHGRRTMESETMALINLSVKHGRTLEEAQRHLETAVREVCSRFKALVQRVEWSADRQQVRIEGMGFWVELWVDTQEVHIRGDIPLLGGLLGKPVADSLKQIVQRTFQKRLT